MLTQYCVPHACASLNQQRCTILLIYDHEIDNLNIIVHATVDLEKKIACTVVHHVTCSVCGE